MLVPPVPPPAASSLGHYQPRSLGIPQHSSPHSSLISRIFPTSRLFPPTRISPSFFWAPFHFLRPLLFRDPCFWSQLFFPGPQALGFLNPDSLCAEAQCMICLLTGGYVSLLMGGFRTYHFYFVQILPKFTASPYQLQLASSRLVLQSFTDQFHILTTTSTCSHYLPPFSIHSLNYFFICDTSEHIYS